VHRGIAEAVREGVIQMKYEAAGSSQTITKCTLPQLVACLSELGVSSDDLPLALVDVLRSGRVRLVEESLPSSQTVH
jgi:hypothetical protein